MFGASVCQMVPTLTRLIARPAQPFADAVGERSPVSMSATGEPVESLRLSPDLPGQTSLEPALRQRLERIGQFDDPRFTRVIRIEPGEPPEAGLVVVSQRPAGVRFSQVLAELESTQTALESRAVEQIAIDLTLAVASFHRAVRDIAIGALAAERVLATPDGHLLIHEQVLGGMFEEFNLPRDLLWKQYRIAVPQMAGRLRIDRRADILQVGVVVLAALLGRRLADDEFPQRLLALSATAFARLQDGRNPARVSAFRSWIMRALQLDARRSFGSALDAEEALGEWAVGLKMPAAATTAQTSAATRAASAPAPARLPEEQSDSSSVLAPPVASIAEATGPSDPGSVMPAPPPDPLRAFDAPLRTAAPPRSLDLARQSDQPQRTDGARQSHDQATLPEVTRQAAQPRSAEAAREASTAPPAFAALAAASSRLTRLVRWLLRPVPVAVLLLAVAGVGGLYWWTLPGSGQARLFVESRPSGADVSLDGKGRGQTPAEFAVDAGTHSLGISAAGRQRVEPIVLMGGERLTRSIELRDLRQIGQLEVRSDPPGGEVMIDGRVIGASPVIADLRPGSHSVRVRRGAGSVRHDVTVMAGTLRSLLVTIDPKQAGSPPRPSQPR